MSRACSGRAQSARFARARTEPPRRTAALAAFGPWPLLACRDAHYPRPLSTPPLAPYSAVVRAFWRHAGVGSAPLPQAAPPKPLPLPTWPLEQCELIRKRVY